MATIFWLGSHQLADGILLNDRKTLRSRTGIHENFLDVAKSARLFIDEIFRLAAAVQPTSHHHFGVLQILNGEWSAVVFKGQ